MTVSLLKHLQNQEDIVEDILDDFTSYAEETDMVEMGLFPDRDAEDRFYVILNNLVDKFLVRDEESQTKIKREELNLLKKWKGGE